MLPGTGEHKVPGHRAERILEGVLRFRRAWGRYHRPDDVNYLLRLFPHVKLQRGYALDYLPLGGSERGWIWPYARREQTGLKPAPPEALAATPTDRLASQWRGGDLAALEVETLYRYLEYEQTAEGVFEYAFFINELWATKSAARDGEWLNLEPLFTRWRFDSVLRRAGTVLRVTRPETYDPIVRLEAQGGEARFLVYHSGAWKRVFVLHCRVAADGSVTRRSGNLVANLG